MVNIQSSIFNAPLLIDAHAHMDHYGKTLEAALAEIVEHRIFTISTAMDVPSYERDCRISERCPLVLPTFGIHPYRAVEYAEKLEGLDPYIERSPLIGEIGLDYHWVRDPESYPAQRRVLEHFLAAAKEQEKIVNLHTKGAEQEILDLLTAYGIERAIIHWYSGPMDILDRLLDFGVYFTVGIELLFSDRIRSIAERMPMDRILTETDNPSAMQWLGDKAGMPVQVRDVVRALAELKAATEEETVATVFANLVRLAKDDPWLADAQEYGEPL